MKKATLLFYSCKFGTTFFCLFITMLCFSACGDDKNVSEQPSGRWNLANNPIVKELAAFVPYIRGSGIYLGDGIVLTAWHIAISSPILSEEGSYAVPAEQHIEIFDRHDDGDNLVIPSNLDVDTQAYCWSSNERDSGYHLASLSAMDDSCVPIYRLYAGQADFVYKSKVVSIGQLLYANKSLDIALLKVEHSDATSPITEVAAPIAGEEVSYVGYPNMKLTGELCHVVNADIVPVRDPDQTNHPSDLVVPSFTMRCKNVAGGASGAPVVRTRDGALLGLIWTADDTLTYVTPVAAWQKAIAEQPHEHEQLARVLERL